MNRLIVAAFGLAFVLLGSASAIDVPTPKWMLKSGGGLKVSVPDVSGISEVHLHFNINKELPGVAAGDYNVMIK